MDIVEELRQDREKGAKRLVEEYKTGLLSLARRFCRDPGDAEELVNRTFAAVVDGIDGFLAQSSFFTWMCQILVNLNANDNRRKANGDIIYPGELPDVPDEDAEGSVYRELDAALLRDAIETLPAEIKKTLMMHYFAGFSVKDIARFLAIPVGTVKWRLLHARKILAVKMGAAAKKPGGKAVLLALALCGLTALGAATLSLPGAARQSTSDIRQSEASDFRPSTSPNLPQPPHGVAESPQQGAEGGAAFTQGENMNATQRSVAMLAATIALQTAGPLAASGDEYQYIISGDPVAAAAAGRTSGESATGPLDVRRCAVAESRTMALTSIKNTGFVIVVR